MKFFSIVFASCLLALLICPLRQAFAVEGLILHDFGYVVSSGLKGVALDIVETDEDGYRAYYMGDTGIKCVTSQDGLVWIGDPLFVPPTATGVDLMFANPWVFRTGDGRWRMIMDGTDADDNRRLYSAISNDGSAFSYEGMVMNGSATDLMQPDNIYFLSVPTGVRLDNGKLRMFYVSGGDDTRSAVSEDDGKTWVRDTGTRIYNGVDPALVRLKSGAYRLIYTDWTEGMRVRRILAKDGFYGLDFTGSGRLLASTESAGYSVIDPEIIIQPDGLARLFLSFAVLPNKQTSTSTIYSAISSEGWTDDLSQFKGWYYTPDEPGTGLSLDVQGDILFMVWYVYDAAGLPVWYVSWAPKEETGVYSGNLRRYTGSPAGPDWSAPSYEVSGLVTVTFSDWSTAELSWVVDMGENSGSKTIEKYMPTLTSGSKDPRRIDGWWIDPDYPGMGFFFEAKGNTLFMGWYHYRPDGTCEWRTLGGWKDVGGFTSTNTEYTAVLQEYSNGQTIGGEYASAVLADTGDSTTLTFTGSGDELSIGMQWQGQTFDLQRYTFNEVP